MFQVRLTADAYTLWSAILHRKTVANAGRELIDGDGVGQANAWKALYGAGGRQWVLTATIVLFFVFANHASAETTLTLWHTLGVGGVEERKLEEAINDFEQSHSGVNVQVTRIPYAQNLAQFINASQAGESPDVVRVSDSELGKMGDVRVNRQPILEDLSAHFTSMEKREYALNLPNARKWQLLALLPVVASGARL